MMARQEFEKILENPDSVLFWLSKSKGEVCNLMGEEVAEMVDYNQCNPHHCYDLFAHTVHTVKNVQKRLSSLSINEPLLLVAVFFHDIGKVQTAKFKENRLVFYGHAQKSSEIARIVLNQMGYEKDEIEHICFYISHHNDFISYVLPDEDYNLNNPYLTEITANNVKEHKIQVESMYNLGCTWNWKKVWFNLIILCYADAEAQSSKVYSGNTVIDSMQHKKNKVAAIESVFVSIYKQI